MAALLPLGAPFGAELRAQDPAPLIHEDRSPVPGSRPGTERWLVMLSHELDLAPLQLAIDKGLSQRDCDPILERLALQNDAARLHLKQSVEQLGGQVLEHFWLVPFSLVEIEPESVAQLRRVPGVAALHPDFRMQPQAPILTSTNADNHGTDLVQKSGIKGRGSAIAILDTGLDLLMGSSGRPHRTFFLEGDPSKKSSGIGGSRVLASYALGAMAAEDVNGHGTGIAAVAAGARWNTSPSSDDGQAPEADLVSYSVAMDSQGTSTSSVAVRAWQQVAADRLKHGLRVANFSYSGSYDPTSAPQQALDKLALVADVLPVVSAGNLGYNSRFSQSCANGLAVGSVDHSLSGPSSGKQVSLFSTIGPLPLDAERYYPDLVAAGEKITTAKADLESGALLDSGTSLSAAQVSGAALLFRSKMPSASALLSKAAILASTEDISARNVTAPRNDRMAYGTGYLRVDRLLQSLGNGALLQESQVDTSQPVVRVSFSAEGRMRYGLAVAWHRTQLSSRNWNDIDVRVLDGSQEIASAQTPRNLYEHLRFVSLRSSTVTIEISGRRFATAASTPFALAIVPLGRLPVPGTATPFGSACPGSAPSEAPSAYLPTSAPKQMGGSRSTFLLGTGVHRYQQLSDASQLTSSFRADGIRFREASYGRAWPQHWIDLEMWLGESSTPAKGMSSSFASNRPTLRTQVLDRKRISLPSLLGSSNDPGAWPIRIPFDRPFVWSGTQSTIYLETVQSGHAGGSQFVDYGIDAWFDLAGNSVARVDSSDLQSGTGFLQLGSGIVFELFEARSQGALPQLSATTPPQIATTNELVLRDAVASSAALAFIGSSRNSWGAVPLPLPLQALGASGCTLLTGMEITLKPAATSPNGEARILYALPNGAALVGLGFHAQALVIDPRANALGLVFSGGLSLQIGG
jgi:hypothetical protein